MKKLPRNIKPNHLMKCLIKMGFADYKGKGSHRRMKHPDGRWTQIPLHAKPIPQGTLKKILDQAEVTLEELEKYY